VRWCCNDEICTMQAFAALLDALSYQPARNAKLRLIET
jgi:DNA ligase-1